MESKLAKEVRLLRAYAVAATVVCAVFIVSAFTLQSRKQKFDELDVERINIVEKDGKLKMVISNQARQHPGIVDGKIIERKEPRPPGIIFFNQVGDEMGGLVYGENGSIGHFGSLTFDKVKNDQTIGFRHLEGDNGAYEVGLTMWQQPNISSNILREKYEAANKLTDEAARKAALKAMADNGEVTTTRLFLGKRRDNATSLVMADIKGRPRIRMQVTPDGTAKLEFLDETGKVLYSLPNASDVPKR